MPHQIFEKQRDFFATGTTLNTVWRIEQLKKLKQSIKKNEKALLEALKADLNKPLMEAYASEIGFIYDEINFIIKNLPLWVKPRPVPTPWFYSGAKSSILPEPYGNTLIISPWNYPVLLTLLPLAGTIAAGNCAIIKPSEYSVNSTNILKQIITQTFDQNYITIIEGAIPETQNLLKENFDHIFFTGSTAGGKAVLEAAAKNLTPVTLELGGKNPVIICKDADIDSAARKIAWGKFINAGQTCVAPDYILVHNTVKDRFITAIKKYIIKLFGENPLVNNDYCSIISDRHFERLSGLIAHGKIVIGGKTDPKTRRITPTVIDEIFSMSSVLMQEEIFGPVLPIIDFDDLRRATSIINSRPKPLSLYLFTSDKETQDYIIKHTSSGGICINDVLLQSSTPYLPFGGVGASGMGRCHGKATFNTFSNQKSIMTLPAKADVKFRYPPYKKLTYFILRLMMR